MNDLLKPLAILAFIGMLFWIFAPASLWNGGGGLTPASKRKAFGDLVLQDLNGATWNSGQRQNTIFIVNTWATWCAPCHAETPALVRIADKYEAHNLQVVGIALDAIDKDGEAAVRDFVRQYQVPYTILISREQLNLTMLPRVIPVTILVDRQGRIAKRYEGAITEAGLTGDIEELLAENQWS